MGEQAGYAAAIGQTELRDQAVFGRNVNGIIIGLLDDRQCEFIGNKDTANDFLVTIADFGNEVLKLDGEVLSSIGDGAKLIAKRLGR